MRLVLPLLLAACAGAARAPDGVRASPDGLAACSPSAVDSFREQLSVRQPRAVRQALTEQHARAVAEWSVCAWSGGLGDWSAPPVADPLSTLATQAMRVPRGSRVRVETVEEMATLAPVPAALFALDELAALDTIAAADPALRVDLVLASLGGWGCPDAREWFAGPDGSDIGFCTDAVDAADAAIAALDRLVALAGPALALDGTPFEGLAPTVSTRWIAAERVWMPLPVTPAVAGVVLPVVEAGRPLQSRAGWALHIDGGGARWSKRPAFRVTRTGVQLEDTAVVDAGPLPPVEGVAVFADGSLSMGALAAQLVEAGVVAPTFAARGPTEIVELPLRVRLDEDPILVDAAPMIGPTVSSVAAVRGRMRAYLDTDQPVPLVALHADVPYQDAAAVVSALAAIAERPIGGVVVPGNED